MLINDFHDFSHHPVLGRGGKFFIGGEGPLLLETLPQFRPLVDQVLCPGKQEFRVKWFYDIIIRSGLQSFQPALPVGLGSEHDHRDVVGGRVVPQLAAKLHPSHHRHHQVGNHQVGDLFNGFLHAFFTVLRFDNTILRAELAQQCRPADPDYLPPRESAPPRFSHPPGFLSFFASSSVGSPFHPLHCP